MASEEKEKLEKKTKVEYIEKPKRPNRYYPQNGTG